MDSIRNEVAKRQQAERTLALLQLEKNTLDFRMKVLTEEMATKDKKIAEANRTISKQLEKLSETEAALHQEKLHRWSSDSKHLEMMVEMAKLKTINAELELQTFDMQANETYESNASSSSKNGTPKPNVTVPQFNATNRTSDCSCMMVRGDGLAAMHDVDQLNSVSFYRQVGTNDSNSTVSEFSTVPLIGCDHDYQYKSKQNNKQQK